MFRTLLTTRHNPCLWLPSSPLGAIMAVRRRTRLLGVLIAHWSLPFYPLAALQLLDAHLMLSRPGACRAPGNVPNSRESTVRRRVASTVPSVQEASGGQGGPGGPVPVKCQATKRAPNGQERVKHLGKRLAERMTPRTSTVILAKFRSLTPVCLPDSTKP